MRKRPNLPRVRYIVDLTSDQLALLRDAPYDSPVVARGKWKPIALELIERGLLERDPSASLIVVRRTLLGNEHAKALTRREVEATTSYITKMQSQGKHGVARGYERSLWLRLIAESTLGFVNGAILRAAIRHV